MNDELTTRLSRQLHDQVDDWHDTPLTLAGVQGRARTIRRRRQAIGTGAVAAAVLAVAIPVGLTLDARTDSTDIPVTPSPTRVVDPVDPDATGSEIGLPYLGGRTLTLPTGEEVQLPSGYSGGAVLDGTVFTLRQDPAGERYELSRLDRLGDVSEVLPLASQGFVTNAGSTALAYVRADGHLAVRGPDAEAADLGDVSSYGVVQPVALVGGPDCPEVAETCVVWFNDSQGGAWVADGTGGVTEAPGSPVAVTDVAEDGRVASVTSVDLAAGGACSAVTDPDGEQVFETCDHTLGRFAPGGAHLSAAPAYESGIGDTFAAVVDADGTEVARYEAPRGDFVRDSAWEDPEHLLVTTYSYEEGWSVVRLGVDGSTETALGPDDSTGDTRPAFTVLGSSS